MKKKILALCDKDAEYTRRFCEYASGKKEYPFEAAAFTSAEKLKQFCQKEEIEVLLISERMADEELEQMVKGEVIILREEEAGGGHGSSIYKYQPCEKVLREMMSFCAGRGMEADVYAERGQKDELQMIGLFTPVHRCMQTTFAVALGEILAKDHKVLYLNFESFSGLEKKLGQEYMTDLSDLLYYASNAREVLVYKLQGMIQKIQNLDYIPPVFSCMDLARITKEQWFLLFGEIGRLTDYEYIILDLSEQIQGLFDILRSCCKVFTLYREDAAALAKMYHYERLLIRTDYEDILEKSKKCSLPFIRNVSFDPLNLTYGELADYVRRIIKEELYQGAV